MGTNAPLRDAGSMKTWKKPHAVAGMVLVDPSHERMLDGASPAARLASRGLLWLQGQAPGGGNLRLKK